MPPELHDRCRRCSLKPRSAALARISLRPGRAYELRPARQFSRLPWHDAASAVLTARYMQQMELGGSNIVPPMVTRVVDRQLTALAVSTVSSYGSKWRRFANYCALNGVSACPAAEVTVLAWMEEDLAATVSAENGGFQQYFSAVNKCHHHCSLPKPAVGEAIRDSCRSIEAGQVKLRQTDTRLRIPADDVRRIVDWGLAADEQTRGGRLDVRAALAVASDFAGGSRGNTGVHLRVGDLVIIAGGEKVMRLRARKGEILHEAVTGREKVLRFPAAQMDGWAALIEKFGRVRLLEDVCGGDARESLYRMSGEARTWQWDVQKMNGFLSRCLDALGIEAPEGYKYSYHSLRHAAASSMAAINVHEARMLWLQGWSSKGVALSTYIDPNCPATAGCYWAFGWLLPPPVAPSAGQLKTLAAALGVDPEGVISGRWAAVTAAWTAAA